MTVELLVDLCFCLNCLINSISERFGFTNILNAKVS